MTSFFKSAKVVHDVDSETDYIEIIYERYVKGQGYDTYVDYLHTKPYAIWEKVLVSKKQSIPYEKFLDTMCSKTIEVRQKMCEIALQNILSEKQNTRTYIRIAHASKIIDPTFQPPWINTKSAWQRGYIKMFCENTLPDIIEMTVDKSRLKYLFNVLNDIQS
jgi:hypothetical protein|tara:strand:- start:5824 stop:6309 length:486 start_codon:yes stop_codon:yes gene_type:complete